MLRNVKDNFLGHRIGARDGSIGKIDDLYFDDENWVIRYLVVGTGVVVRQKRTHLPRFEDELRTRRSRVMQSRTMRARPDAEAQSATHGVL